MTTALTSEQIFEEVLLPLIDEVEEEVGEEIGRDRDTILLGEGSALDSLAVVTLLVSVEEEIASRTGQEIRLVDERAMSKKASPFRTLGTLSDHICELL
jgi:acyl carrier protein